MGCCKDKFGNDLYVPLNQRLIEYGKSNTDSEILTKFPETHIWIFSFLNQKDTNCEECVDKLRNMVMWFNKYDLLKSPTRNIKWIFEDDMKSNLICRDIGITKSPTHLICNKNGNILDIVVGFPDVNWLQKNVLPLVSGEMVVHE